MGALALLGPPLLLQLLIVLCGHPLGMVVQAQSCSVNTTYFQVEENSDVTEPLVDIYVPKGQQVTLGSSSTPFAFRIVGNQLFLNVTPDYEEIQMLEAQLECKRGSTVVSQLKVLVSVVDVNDNAPEFNFTTKEQGVEEDTKVGSIVIPGSELQATDRDTNDILFYTLQEVTPGASSFFSLLGANRPALRLDRPLDFYKTQNMTFQLLVRDTWDEHTQPSHTATATLVLRVLPADLRPPWFLPCTYSDGYVCIQAQYHGAVPTGHTLPSPLILRPGPIYAVDGDQGINEQIIYSIMGGNQEGTFAIDADSGNLTMVKSIPSPTTFLLLVRAEQADLARYSVTQVTVEARAATGSLLNFPQSLYRGIVAPGSGAGVPVKDAASPSQPLRIWAQDPEFPVLNSAITYRITNCSEFRMDGEAVLTAMALEHAGVFYAEVEATNTVTSGTATTVAEIHVSEQEAPPTEAVATPGPSSGTASQASSAPGTSQGPPTTSSGEGTAPRPPSGTTLRPPASPAPGETPTAGTGTSSPTATPGGDSAPTPKPETPGPNASTAATDTSPQTATPGGDSAPTPKPETPGPTTPTAGTVTSPPTAMPGGDSTPILRPETPGPTTPTVGTVTSPPTAMPGGDSTPTLKPETPRPTASTAATATSPQKTTPGGDSAPTLKPEPPGSTAPGPSKNPITSGLPGGGGIGADSEPGGGRRFSTVDMAVLGGVLGALLLLALIGLAILIHKHYGHRLKCCAGKAAERQPWGMDNKAFLSANEANWTPTPSPEPGPEPVEAPPVEAPPTPPSPSCRDPTLTSPVFPSPTQSSPGPPSSSSLGRASRSPMAAQSADSPSAVRSILTKERRPEGGYKAVWFGEDIGAEADVVVLNTPSADADGAGDSGSDGEDAGHGGRPPHVPGTDSTYI